MSSPLDPNHLPGLLAILPARILVLAGIVALVYRYRRDAVPVQKQQIKWMVAGAALLTLVYFAEFCIYQLYPGISGHGLPFFQTPA